MNSKNDGKGSLRENLIEIFQQSNADIQTVVEPLIDDLCFIEDRIEEMRKLPMLKVHPTNPAKTKQTDAAKLYKDLLAQKKDIVRILCTQIRKSGDEGGNSPLRDYLRTLNETTD